MGSDLAKDRQVVEGLASALNSINDSYNNIISSIQRTSISHSNLTFGESIERIEYLIKTMKIFGGYDHYIKILNENIAFFVKIIKINNKYLKKNWSIHLSDSEDIKHLLELGAKIIGRNYNHIINRLKLRSNNLSEEIYEEFNWNMGNLLNLLRSFHKYTYPAKKYHLKILRANIDFFIKILDIEKKWIKNQKGSAKTNQLGFTNYKMKAA